MIKKDGSMSVHEQLVDTPAGTQGFEGTQALRVVVFLLLHGFALQCRAHLGSSQGISIEGGRGNTVMEAVAETGSVRHSGRGCRSQNQGYTHILHIRRQWPPPPYPQPAN